MDTIIAKKGVVRNRKKERERREGEKNKNFICFSWNFKGFLMEKRHRRQTNGRKIGILVKNGEA